MDTRNGQMYDSPEAARAAGVPDEHIAQVEPVVVRVTSGPFKGRIYERTESGGLRRIDGGGPGVFKTDGNGNLVKVRI